MIADDAMEVHFLLKLLVRAADHVSCHNYPGVNQARECGTCSVGQVIRAYTLKDTFVNWTKFGCEVPAFPLGPQHSQPSAGAGQG